MNTILWFGAILIFCGWHYIKVTSKSKKIFRLWVEHNAYSVVSQQVPDIYFNQEAPECHRQLKVKYRVVLKDKEGEERFEEVTCNLFTEEVKITSEPWWDSD